MVDFKKVFLFLVVGLFMISFVSAAEFDNVREYNPTTREATFYNTFLGFKTTEIGKARLNTPLNLKVGRGYQKVAEFDLWAYKDYNDALKQLTFKDMNKGKEKINRDYDLKYLSYEEVLVNDYNVTYLGLDDNGDEIFSREITGDHYENKETWNKITPADLKKNDFLTIGVFTEVLKGDFIDWIPMIYGVEIKEWATWTESINADILSYYSFEDSVGDVVVDSVGNYNGVNYGAEVDGNGHIGNAYRYVIGNTDYVAVSPLVTEAFDGDFTFSFWFNRDNDGTAEGMLSFRQDSGNYIGVETRTKSSVADIQSSVIFSGGSLTINKDNQPSGVWTSYVIKRAGTNVSVFYDNNIIYTNTAAGNDEDISNNEVARFGSDRNGAQYFDGMIDEAGFWGRALSDEELTEVFESTTGYIGNFNNAPNITLNSPASNNYTAAQNLIINFSAFDDVALSDIKLYVNGILNQTNATGINNSDYLFPLALGDGNYTINGVATDDESETTNSSELIIFIDSIDPVISLTAIDDIVLFSEARNITLNWTTTDLNLESCYYNYNGTDIIVACGDNTANISYNGKNNLTFYANDTLGNLASEFISWNSYLVLNELSYDAAIYETGNTTIAVNISYDISDLSVSGILNYNGVNYTTIKSVEANGAHFSKSFNIPAGRVGEANNFSWYFIITDGYTGRADLGEYNQTITETYLGYCGGAYTTTGLNFSFWDEDSGAIINASANPVTFEGTFTYWIGNGGYTKNFSISDFNVTNSSYPICISPNNSIETDLILSYSANEYAPNSYYLAEASLTNATNNIKLWLLPLTTGQKFYITAFSGIASLDGATITAAKYFEGEGVYKTTGIGKTDSGGKFTMYLDADKQYIFYGVSGGASIGSVEKGAFCETAPCELTLQFFSESGDLLDGYNDIYAGDVVYTLAFNETSDIVQAVFSDITGTASYFRFEVNRVSLNNSNLNVCDQTLYTTSGAMSCNMSGLTGTYTATLVISRSPEKVIDFIQFIVGGLQDALGATGLIVSLLFLIVIVFSGLRNPVIAVVLIPVALVMLKLMDILPISWLWVASVAVLAFLIVGRLKT